MKKAQPAAAVPAAAPAAIAQGAAPRDTDAILEGLARMKTLTEHRLQLAEAREAAAQARERERQARDAYDRALAECQRWGDVVWLTERV